VLDFTAFLLKFQRPPTRLKQAKVLEFKGFLNFYAAFMRSASKK
jgi:hypothetical protein